MVTARGDFRFVSDSRKASVEFFSNLDLSELDKAVAERLHLQTQEGKMLYVLAVILLIAWLLGVVGTYTIGAFVHVLLVIAVVLFIVGLLSGRRTIV